MAKKLLQKNRYKGFSLIELSIVILIVSILITGALSISVNSVNAAKTKTTNDRIALIYRALGNYLAINKRLPCPASLKALKTDTTYGIELGSAGACAATGDYVAASGYATLFYGMVPSVTLGLGKNLAEDGFESKFAYMVDQSYTSISTFPTASTGMTIIDRTGGADQTIETAAIFAIISYGPNKSGAFSTTSTTRSAQSTDTQELDNDLGATIVEGASGTGTFNGTLYVSSGNSDVFDDIVFYKNRNAMIYDFDLLSLIPCSSASANDVTYGATTIVWPAGNYGQIVAATTSCPTGYTSSVTKPTKRCGAFGVWQAGTVNPCLAP